MNWINGIEVAQGSTIAAAVPATLVIKLSDKWPGGWAVVNDKQPGFGLRKKSDGTAEIPLPAHGDFVVRVEERVNGGVMEKRETLRFKLVAPASTWVKGIISDDGTTDQVFSIFSPMGVRGARPWIKYDNKTAAITGAARVLQANELVKRGWVVDAVLSNPEKSSSVVMPDLKTLMKNLDPRASVGCQNEIDHDNYWPLGASKGFAAGVQHSQAIADQLTAGGFKADSFSLSKINAGEITNSWKVAKSLGCTRFAAVRGHAYDWNYDGNPASFLLKMERIISEYYSVAQWLGVPLKIDEIGLPNASVDGSNKRRVMDAQQIAYVVPKLFAILKRYTVAAYVFIATPTNGKPVHNSFPRLVDDLSTGKRTAFGNAFAAVT